MSETLKEKIERSIARPAISLNFKRKNRNSISKGKGVQKTMRFEIPIVPPTVTAQHKGAFYNKKLGRIMFFTKKEVQQGEDTLYSVLKPYRPNEPIKGAVRLLIQ